MGGGERIERGLGVSAGEIGFVDDEGEVRGTGDFGTGPGFFGRRRRGRPYAMLCHRHSRRGGEGGRDEHGRCGSGEGRRRR